MGCHALLQGNLPNPGTEPGSPALQADSFPAEPPGKPILAGEAGNTWLLRTWRHRSTQGTFHYSSPRSWPCCACSPGCVTPLTTAEASRGEQDWQQIAPTRPKPNGRSWKKWNDKASKDGPAKCILQLWSTEFLAILNIIAGFTTGPCVLCLWARSAGSWLAAFLWVLLKATVTEFPKKCRAVGSRPEHCQLILGV